MTKNELQKEHRLACVSSKDSEWHTKISVEYAISVLESLKGEKKAFNSGDLQNLPVRIETKIEELKKLVE